MFALLRGGEGANMNKLKSLRKEKNLTQQQAADYVGISLRSYKSYENDADKRGTIKYKYIYNELLKINPIDETHGVIDIEYIRSKCKKVLKKYDVSYCYVFGSYAKGKAKSTSDVDLLISSNISGLKFFGMVEELRKALRKEVDVLDIKQLKNNLQLIEEILSDGVKIYG